MTIMIEAIMNAVSGLKNFIRKGLQLKALQILNPLQVCGLNLCDKIVRILCNFAKPALSPAGLAHHRPAGNAHHIAQEHCCAAGNLG